MKLWLALSAFLVFAAGAALAFVLARSIPSPEPHAAPAWPNFSPDMPPYLVTSEEVYRELELDESQRAVIDFLLESHYKRVKDVRVALQELSEDLLKGVSAALKPAQWQKFEEIQRRYAEKDTQAAVRWELTRLRVDLGLTPEQEARTYQVLYDLERERKEWWRRNRKSDREKVRAKMDEMHALRDSKLTEILTSEQQQKYVEMKERDRKLWGERKDWRKKKPEEVKPDQEHPAKPGEAGRKPGDPPGAPQTT
jgi:hypothetical protein